MPDDALVRSLRARLTFAIRSAPTLVSLVQMPSWCAICCDTRTFP
jgi:hypothetical protein